MLSVGQRHILKCDEMNNLASSVCRIDGMVVFVRGAVTGDTVEAEIEKVNSSYALARTVKILTPSPYRIEPECPHFGVCGGCVFSHITIDKENEIKSDYVKNALKKHGIDAQVEKTQCPVSDFYRNKVVLFYENGAFGYMEHATNRVVAHKSCMLNGRIFDEIADFTLTAVDTKWFRALYLRKSSGEGEIMVCPIFKKPTDIKSYAISVKEKFPRVSSVMRGVISDKDFVLEACKYELVLGNPYINDELCSLRLEISPRSFYQVNHDCAEALYEKAISYLGVNENSKVADLFCGTGTIGMIVAKRTRAHVYGVEIEADAVRDAKRNAKSNGIENIEFFEGDAKDFDKKVDACIIDPPRKGCSPLAIETLLRLAPKKIVYVSCNPDTLARDLKALSEKYEISTLVTPFNMFPRTSHVESLVCLTRQTN